MPAEDEDQEIPPPMTELQMQQTAELRLHSERILSLVEGEDSERNMLRKENWDENSDKNSLGEETRTRPYLEREKSAVGAFSVAGINPSPVEDDAPEEDVLPEEDDSEKIDDNIECTQREELQNIDLEAEDDVEAVTYPHHEVVTAAVISEEMLEDELRSRIFSNLVVAEVEENISRPPPAPEQKEGQRDKSRLLKACGIFALVIFSVAAVLIGVFVSRSKESSTESPTESLQLTASQQSLLDFIASVSFEEGRLALSDRSSPQFRAFLWLSTDDGIDRYSHERLIQRYAMATLFYSTNGESWLQNDLWLSDDNECDWLTGSFLKQCDVQSMRQLSLPNNNLSGTIPPELGMLSTLQVIDLNSNSIIRGTIPTDFYRLTKLTSLSLSGTGLTGTISTHIQKLHRLELVDLQSNGGLTGTLPSEISVLTSLRVLTFEKTSIGGTLPTELGSLTKLQLFSARKTKVESFPSEIGLLTNLKTLFLNGARLTGHTIFPEFYHLTSLTSLSFVNSGISGTLSTLIGSLTNLEELKLSVNNLHGTIPTEIGLLTNLKGAWFTQNKFHGTIPTEFRHLAIVEKLSVKNNAITGRIPSEIGEIVSLTSLYIQTNLITGKIPTELGQLTNLEELTACNNSLTGQIPTEMGVLSNLRMVDFTANRITGTLPTEEDSIWSLPALELFGVGDYVSGTIPSTIGLATNMVKLYLHSNHLTGSVPTEIGQMTKLEELAVAYNLLSSQIPSELNKLTLLETLHAQNNNFSGTIPHGLTIGTAFFDTNELSGSMPTSLCSSNMLFADCAEVSCSCCTHCCNDTTCIWTGSGEDPSDDGDDSRLIDHTSYPFV